MKEDAGLTLARQWTMLRAIPRAPLKITTSELSSRLVDEGFEVSRRTIERDLHALSGPFPLVLDDRAKPYGWSWAKNANFEFMPRLSSSQAVALLLAREHLRTFLPVTMSKDLSPVFDAADSVLIHSGWKDWHKRTAVISPTLSLLPPKIGAKVMQVIQEALAHKRCLSVRYRTKGARESKAMKLHPLGLLSRGPVLYLVCTLFNYEDVRQLALHRFSDAVELADPSRQPAGFDFRVYASTSARPLLSKGRIALVCRFSAPAAEHLRETPLAIDQTLADLDDGERVEVRATVEDDEQLRWWLRAFGVNVEVIEPKALRSEMHSEAAQVAHLHASDRLVAKAPPLRRNLVKR